MKNILAVVGVFTFCLAVAMPAAIPTEKPNILFILVDDAGWADVSWNNAEMHTPNLKAMAEAGVIFNQSYVQSVCTPSRASLLTGKYPHNIGMRDDGVIKMDEAYGLPTDQVLLPAKLKTVGYDTHLVGKWHLGFCDDRFTPTQRGFDTFYGFLGSAQTYDTHMENGAYDFRENEDLLSSVGGYNTDLFTARTMEIIENKTATSDPWFLYLAYSAIHTPISDPPDNDGDGVGDFLDEYTDTTLTRTKAAAMMSYADDGIAQIKAKLLAKGILDNTLIVFVSDNGGTATNNGGNNWPLRGQKKTLWEGGIKTPAFVYNSGSLITKTGYTNDGLLHISDWAPTLLTIAGYTDVATDGFDGVNQWDMVAEGAASARTEIVHHMAQTLPKANINDPKGVIRMGNYKLHLGDIGSGYNEWYADPLDTGVAVPVSTPDKTYNRNGALLFNIADDPNEETDLSSTETVLVAEMTQRLEDIRSSYFVYMDLASISTSTSSVSSGNWVTGWCDSDVLLATLTISGTNAP